ncbi:MAG TPA: transcriptional regulator [Myxococcales bacterium]|nr:transcriptional regulator [Myxococcales bacterium]
MSAKALSLCFIGLGLVLVVIGHGLGLFVAPKEAMMGDVGRILYVHVPTAWVALLTYLIAFVAGIGSLWTGGRKWDATLEASVEVGVLLNVMLTIQGSIWAKPTWGIWWTWDPRLTTTAIMVLSFVGVLLLRALITDPDRRQTFSAVGAIVAFVNVPIVYLSVKWWRTLHQPFSSPDTVSSPMVTPLRIAAFGMLFLMIGMIIARARIALRRILEEVRAPSLPDSIPEPLRLEE